MRYKKTTKALLIFVMSVLLIGLLAGCSSQMFCKHETTRIEGAINSSCITEGFTGKTICENCGKILDEGKTIEKNKETNL